MGLRRITGVVNKAAKAGAADRALIKKQQDAMNKDMQKAIVRSIQIGEAKSKASNQRLTTKVAVRRLLTTTCLSRHILPLSTMTFKPTLQRGRAPASSPLETSSALWLPSALSGPNPLRVLVLVQALWQHHSVPRRLR